MLKALFLVKYVKEFKPTARNLCVLMLDRFDADLPALRKRVEEALNLLEQQTYIQRNGELYEYLTDEEKDIEQEIKNTEVETDATSPTSWSKLIFDQVIKDREDPLRRERPGLRLLAQAGRPAARPRAGAGHPRHQPVPRARRQRDRSCAPSRMGRDELLVVLPPGRPPDARPADVQADREVHPPEHLGHPAGVGQAHPDRQGLPEPRPLQPSCKDLVGALLGKAKLLVAGGDVEVSSRRRRRPASCAASTN